MVVEEDLCRHQQGKRRSSSGGGGSATRDARACASLNCGRLVAANSLLQLRPLAGRRSSPSLNTPSPFCRPNQLFWLNLP